jgi:hypothetical protein
MRIIHPSIAERLRLDAAETAFFERELMHIYATTYDVRYPELKARQFVPVSNQAGAGASSVNYRQFNRVGKAKVIAHNAKDLPRVDVFGKEFIRPVRTIGDSYGYTLMELREAAMAGRSLNSMRATAARRAHEELLDFIACFGSPDDGIVDGFLNNANIPVTGAGATFETLNADQIINIIGLSLERIQAVTLGVEKPNTLLLPETTHALLSVTPRSAVSDTTILEFVKRSFPGLTTVEPWYRLEGAGAGGVKRMVLYNMSPDKLQQEIASEFEQLPVQERGLEFEVPCISRTAGTALYYPKAIDFTDGV